ncbi:MAG: glycogen synthase GlgA [candidate division Zixibacteria bacterium]
MQKLKILFAASEAVPFVKTGGLADVSGMLPQKLAELGHAVKVALPRYSAIPENLMNNAQDDITFDIDIDKASHSLDLIRLVHNKHDLEYLFIGNDFFYDRPELYRDPKTGKDYIDNDDRFLFFCRGILELLPRIKFHPDLIHANDWQTALLPAFLKTAYEQDIKYAEIKSILTIHNLAYQGLFPDASFDKLGLEKDLFYATRPFEFWGKLNFLKAGIIYADVISTVSQTYAKEIQSSKEYGAGLEGVLKERSDDLYGIINGVDYNEWSPSKDKHLFRKYNQKNFSGKKINKIELLKHANLPPRDNVPLIGMISRLADQKGFDLLSKAADELLSLDIQMIILGTGEKKYHRLLQDLQTRFPDKLKAFITYDNTLAHRIEAGADMFLMPSRYEPCGLNQLYSLKYGTVPIVRATGGLADTIEQVDFDYGTGTGYLFEKYGAKAMMTSIKQAVRHFSKKRKWRQIMKNGMSKDNSWDASARKYVELYNVALSKK